MMFRNAALYACVATLMACGASRGSITGGDGSEGVPFDGQDFLFDTPFDVPDTPGEIPTPDIVIDQPDVPLDFLPDDTPYTDEDGDTIRDEDEGNGAIDSDGDTLPDTQDLDSDGDGIPDADEAGDDNPLSLPVDSDMDGTPDFRDIDSDGDTIADADEGMEDADGDGIPNYRDIDSDGDFISDNFEAGDGNVSTPPLDTDSDGTPDFLDLDSDGDAIADLEESIQDTDADGLLDYVDTDSDGDGLPDAEEAGDTDIATPAWDCGDDPLANFRDTDSDNDGVADADEIARGTQVCNPDSDGDGVTDLIEIAYGSDPLSPADSPRTHGDFVFIVAYMETPDPTVDTLVFSTDIKQADVYFLVDTTGSMWQEVATLRSSISSTVIPGMVAAIPDIWTGVGHFDDYPYGVYGWTGDESYENLQNLTSNPALAQAAATNLPDGSGYDSPESHVTALYTTASGSPAYTMPMQPSPSCGAGFFGYPCFRTGSVPIIILISDAPFHNGPSGEDPYSGVSAPSYAQAVAALVAAHIKVIGVHSDTWSADTHYRRIATDTGAVDSAGNPLAYNIPGDGSGLGSQVIAAVQTLSNQVPIEVSTTTEDNPVDAVDARIFIERIQPNTVGGVADPLDPTKICVGGLAVADRTGDGFPDVFTSVLPGTTVCFDIYPRMNTSVEPLTVPQIFEAFIHVIGDGITVLDTRSVFFLVPPEIQGSN